MRCKGCYKEGYRKGAIITGLAAAIAIGGITAMAMRDHYEKKLQKHNQIIKIEDEKKSETEDTVEETQNIKIGVPVFICYFNCDREVIYMFSDMNSAMEKFVELMNNESIDDLADFEKKVIMTIVTANSMYLKSVHIKYFPYFKEELLSIESALLPKNIEALKYCKYAIKNSDVDDKSYNIPDGNSVVTVKRSKRQCNLSSFLKMIYPHRLIAALDEDYFRKYGSVTQEFNAEFYLDLIYNTIVEKNHKSINSFDNAISSAQFLQDKAHELYQNKIFEYIEDVSIFKDLIERLHIGMYNLLLKTNQEAFSSLTIDDLDFASKGESGQTQKSALEENDKSSSNDITDDNIPSYENIIGCSSRRVSASYRKKKKGSYNV